MSGTKLRNWGLLALAILMLGALLKQPFVKTAWKGFATRLQTTGQPVATGEGDAADNNETPEAAVTEAETADDVETAAEAEPAAGTEEPPAGEDDTEEADTEEADTSENTPAAANNTAEGQTSDGQTADNQAATPEEIALAKEKIEQADAAIEQRQYSDALIALQQVPSSQRDAAFSATLARARAGTAAARETNASLLTDARTSIQPTQASQFSEAIAKARRIKQGEPSYAEAQEDIRNWSQIILDIAEGRATSGNLNGAIAAARVMPRDNADAYQRSQERIQFWNQRQNSRNIIAEAQKIPKTGQASTYQKGIVKLREVPIEHPEYETAQRLADEWSQRIFSIAQARAAQGRQSAAIQAAVLVPAGTTAYEPTQQAIRKWRAE